jgi:hypothetical protein
MDILTESEIQEINSKSKLVKKYSELDRDSAYEILIKKIDAANEQTIERKKQIRKNEPSTATTLGKSALKVTSASFIRAF